MNFARLVALISVTLGSMALIISLSVLDGFESALKTNAVKFTSHIKVKSFSDDNISNPEQMIKKIKAIYPEVKTAVPVVEREGLISSTGFVEGVVVRGTSRNYDITGLNKNIILGKFDFSSIEANEIIIGKRLAKKLNAEIGSDVVVYAIKGESLSKFEMPEIEKFKVIGIYETGMSQYDDIYIYIPFRKAQTLFKMPQESAGSLDLLLNDINLAPYISKKLNDELGYPYYAYTVFDLHSAVFAWIELQKAPIPLVLGLISIVAVFNILTILLITVVEKTHSIGILRAIGMSSSNIIKIFILQGLVIGTIGTLLGCGIGLTLGLIQQNYHIFTLEGDIYFLDTLPVKFYAWHFIVVIGMSLLLSFLATLVPSFIASRIQPIRAIRFK
jgi:lipoprotein-releasing system permease protein